MATSTITWPRGIAMPITYNYVDSSGNHLNLSNKTLYFTIKATKNDDAQSDTGALLQKTISTHTNPTGGVSQFSCTDADLYIEPGKYYFDFVIEDKTSLQSEPPAVYGTFVVTGHPTNRNTVNG